MTNTSSCRRLNGAAKVAQVEVLLGTLTLEPIGVKKQILHDEWRSTAENDIALLELDGPVILEGKHKTQPVQKQRDQTRRWVACAVQNCSNRLIFTRVH